MLNPSNVGRKCARLGRLYVRDLTLIAATLLLAAGFARPAPANAREDCNAIKLNHPCLDPTACRIRENNYSACLKRNETTPDLAADPNLRRTPPSQPLSPTARNQNELRAAARAMRAKYPPTLPPRPAPSARSQGPGPAPIPDACGLFNSCSN